MKKKFSALLGLVLCSSMLFSACGEKAGDSSQGGGNSAPEKFINLVDSAVTLDCFESYQMDVEMKGISGDVVWSSSDPSVIAVEDGVATSTIKEGKATITATVGGYSDSCEVVVMVKSGNPSVSVKNEITVSEGGVYAMNPTAQYNGMDITEYISFGVNAFDETQTAVTATAENNVITFVGEAEGSAEFSVYTTIFGQLYAEEVSITVKNTDLAYVVGGGNDDGVLLTKGGEVYTSDVAVYYQGTKVDNSALTWSIVDENIATIGAGGLLQFKKEGKTYLTTEYEGDSIAVNVTVRKDRASVEVAQETIPYVNCDMQIEWVATVPSLEGIRTVTVNETNVDTITLPDVVEGGSVYAVSVDGVSMDASCFSYDTGVISVQTKVFGTDIYGEKTLTVLVEGVDTIYSYTLKAIIVTKRIHTLLDYKNCIVVGWKGDTSLGYFTLGCDMDFDGRAYAVYANDWNYLHGFRGTFDGAGYKIINYAPSQFGLTSQVGEGAVFKNLVFENVTYNGDNMGVLTYGAQNVTFENITISSFAPESTFAARTDTTADQGGLFVSHQTMSCIYRNITVHAEGFAISSLVGGRKQDEKTANNVYENVQVYAKSVRYYECCSKTRPDGITLTKVS